MMMIQFIVTKSALIEEFHLNKLTSYLGKKHKRHNHQTKKAKKRYLMMIKTRNKLFF